MDTTSFLFNEIDKPIKAVVTLPDGKIVDIATKEGANTFLNGVSSFNYFSTKLEEIRKLRKKQGNKKRLGARNMNKLKELFDFIDALAIYADRETFRAKIPESEIQDWLNWMIEEFQFFSKIENIKASSGHCIGCMNSVNLYVLGLCHSMFLRHAVVVDLAFNCDFFQVVSNFVKVRKGNGSAVPCTNICDFIGKLAFYTFASLLLHGWSVDNIFKKFEESGFLEQILRCSTVPKQSGFWHDTRGSPDYFLFILDELVSCIGLLTQKFNSGEPCGETLKAIIDGQDGSESIEPKILNKLKCIARLVKSMDTTDFKATLAFGTCSHCSKNGDPELLFCSRCRFVLYCSEECQKAAWKRHKRHCQKLAKPDWDRAFSLQMATRRFMNQNSEVVFKEIDKKCGATGLKASEMVVEISFMTNTGECVIPTLQDPPFFHVGPIEDYISGDAVAQWFGKLPKTDLRRSWIQHFVQKMEMDCKSPSGTLLLIHHARRVYIDFETVEQYRQERSCVDHSKIKPATLWCSHPMSVFHKIPFECAWDSQVIDSTFQLGNINPK